MLTNKPTVLDNAKGVWKKWRVAWTNTHVANKAVAIATSVAALASVIYAVVAVFQLVALDESNRFNREALVSVQRAFITFLEGSGERGFDHEQPVWSFTIRVENSGTTPAINVVSFAGADDFASEPTGETFYGTSKTVARNGMVIGPRVQKIIAIIDKPDEFVIGERFDPRAPVVARPFPGHKAPFLWAWVVYRDVFPGTEPHLTESCTRIVNTQVTRVSPPEQPSFRSNITNCDHHNCADRNCDDYDKVVALAYGDKP
jgi:hypothetical protein